MLDMTVIENWNHTLFGLLRGMPDMPASLVAAGVWLAELPVYIAVLLMLVYVLRSKDYRCLGALAVALSCAGVFKFVLSRYAYHARPFEAGFGSSLIQHAADSSFPSSHVTFVLVLAVICATRGQWRLTGFIALLGLVMAWARVFVGVHWPFDMLGALVVAIACGLIGTAVMNALCGPRGNKGKGLQRNPLTS